MFVLFSPSHIESGLCKDHNEGGKRVSLTPVSDSWILHPPPPNFVNQFLKMKAAISDSLPEHRLLDETKQMLIIRFKQRLYVLMVKTKSFFIPGILNPVCTFRSLAP